MENPEDLTPCNNGAETGWDWKEKGRNALSALARFAIPEDPRADVPPEKEGTNGPSCEPASVTGVGNPGAPTPCAFPPNLGIGQEQGEETEAADEIP